MANRIAELMVASERAGQDPKKAKFDSAIEKLILDLWAHRAALPGNVDPNKRLSKAIDILEKLEKNEGHFMQRPYQGGQLEKEALAAYHLAESLVVKLFLLKLLEEHPDPDETELPLNAEEVELRRKIQALMRQHVRGSSFAFAHDPREDARSDEEILKEKIDAGALQATEALVAVRHLLTHGKAQQGNVKKDAKIPRRSPLKKV